MEVGHSVELEIQEVKEEAEEHHNQVLETQGVDVGEAEEHHNQVLETQDVDVEEEEGEGDVLETQ